MMRYIVSHDAGQMIVCGRIRHHKDGTYDWEVWSEPTVLTQRNALAHWSVRCAFFKTIRQADEAAEALGIPDHRVETIDMCDAPVIARAYENVVKTTGVAAS